MAGENVLVLMLYQSEVNEVLSIFTVVGWTVVDISGDFVTAVVAASVVVVVTVVVVVVVDAVVDGIRFRSDVVWRITVLGVVKTLSSNFVDFIVGCGSSWYDFVTLSTFKMFAVKFSGTFGSGFTFSIVVFLVFMRTALLVIVNGRKVDTFSFFCVKSPSVLVTSKDPSIISGVSSASMAVGSLTTAGVGLVWNFWFVRPNEVDDLRIGSSSFSVVNFVAWKTELFNFLTKRKIKMLKMLPFPVLRTPSLRHLRPIDVWFQVSRDRFVSRAPISVTSPLWEANLWCDLPHFEHFYWKKLNNSDRIKVHLKKTKGQKSLHWNPLHVQKYAEFDVD